MGDVISIANAVRSGSTSAKASVQASLERIEALNGTLGAFISVNGERALEQAGRIDEGRSRGAALGPLAGVPIAIKDNICTTFADTTCGSRILAAHRPLYDAFVVEQLERAGAVIVGKTNLDEFAMGSSTEHSAFARTCNPWDLERVAGGSSGGSACAVASGMVPAALGSDTGGSVRLPASFCGVVGLKPSYGRVSRYGLVAYGSSLDQIGPLARDVDDAALLLGVIAACDRRDSTCVDEPVPDYSGSLGATLKGLRIGVDESMLGAGLDASTEASVRAALDLLEKEGAVLVPIALPSLKYAIACYYLIVTAEASSNLARFDGVHYGHRADAARDIHELYESSRGEGFGAEVKRRIMLGTYALSSGYYDQYYVKALKVRTLIQREFASAFEKIDLIASPAVPNTAFRIGEKSNDPLAMYLEDVYTVPANLCGTCAVSIPCGFDGAGMPIGLQLMGPAFGETRLLSAAAGFQRVTDFHKKVPPISHTT